MERFEKALAKARREKKTSGTNTVPSDEPSNEVNQSGTSTSALEQTQVKRDQLKDLRAETAAPAYNGSLVALNFTDHTADLFRILRTQILNGLAKLGTTTLGLCSSRAGEGKTFVAANLAASIALSQEHAVLVIDLDLRRPRIHKLFNMDQTPGVTNFLSGTALLSDCIRKSAVPGLEVLPAGASIRNSSEALGSSQLAQAFAKLRDEIPSRILICDLPPILASDDALSFSSQLGAMLLVVEEGRTRPGELQRSLELLGSSKVLGTVLNKSKYTNPFPYVTHYGDSQ